MHEWHRPRPAQERGRRLRLTDSSGQRSDEMTRGTPCPCEPDQPWPPPQEVELGERLVAYAAGRRNSRPALALLRVMAVLGTPAQREAAAAGAAALAAAGVPGPAWADDLRRVRHTGSWAYGDVFGDQTSVLVAFDRPGRPHGVMVLVDHTLDGIAKDAFVVDDPAGTLSDMRATADETAWVRELTDVDAATLLVPAFAATDAGRELPLGEDFRDTRALVVARLGCFPNRRWSCRAGRRTPSRSPRNSSPPTPDRATSTPTPSSPARGSWRG